VSDMAQPCDFFRAYNGLHDKLFRASRCAGARTYVKAGHVIASESFKWPEN